MEPLKTHQDLGLQFVKFRFERVSYFWLIFMYFISLHAFYLSSKRDLAVPSLIKDIVYLALNHTQSFLWVLRIPVTSFMSQTQKRGDELASNRLTQDYSSPKRKWNLINYLFSHIWDQICCLSLIQWKVFSLHSSRHLAAPDLGALSP